jgi:hypothetical protein
MRRHTHGLVEGGVFDNAFYPCPEYRKRRRFHLRRLSFLASTGLTIALLGTGSAHAACDNHDPATGQTATCDTSAPNPDITRVEAAAGSTNVTVVVQPGAGLDVTNINGIFVRDLSEVTNQGNITVTGDTFDGIRFDNNNTITNGGTITTGGALSEGMFSDGGDNNVILNTGTIITGGADSQGILLFTGSTGNTVTNEGTITTTGDNAVGMEAAGDGNVFTNSGMITTSGPNANGILVTGGNNTITNAGTGTITTTGATAHGVVGNGSNNTLTNSGDINVSGPNAHGINWLGATLGTVTNAGTITVTGAGGLGAFFSSPAAFSNTSTGSVVSQQANGIIINGGGTVDNAGEISGQQVGVVAANGPTVVTNSGTISGVTAQGVLFQGAFNDSLTNTGTIKWDRHSRQHGRR